MCDAHRFAERSIVEKNSVEEVVRRGDPALPIIGAIMTKTAASPNAPVVAVPANGELVLFVEDAADVRSLHAIHLRKAGYRVAEATNGVEGVERAIELQPALVLMDLAMPLVDGFEATRRLKNHPKTAHIPVIVLTAYGYQGYLREAAACRCDAFLTKPVSGAELVERVRSVLDDVSARRG